MLRMGVTVFALLDCMTPVRHGVDLCTALYLFCQEFCWQSDTLIRSL